MKEDKNLTKAGEERKRPAREGEGRPRNIQNPDELVDKFDAYIADCLAQEKTKTPAKRHFLATCGFYKDLMNHYHRNYKEEFSSALKYIDEQCEAFTEVDMINNTANYGAGKFSLMNNYGWKDKSDDNKGMTIIINDKSKEITKIND